MENNSVAKAIVPNNIMAKNVNFQKKFYGINVSDLLKNITTIGTLQHIKEKYHNLLDIANEVEKSLKHQAVYLEYYKQVSPSIDATEMFIVNCGDKDDKIMSFRKETGSNIMEFLEWDEKKEIFNFCCAKNLGGYPSYMNKINLDGRDAVYIEYYNKSNTEDYTGRLMSCKNTSIEWFGNFLTKGTLFLTNFEITSQHLQCLLFVDFNYNVNILCSGPNKVFYLHQVIENKNPVMASITKVEDDPYLVTIHKEVEKKTVIWKLNQTNQFQVYRTYHEGDPVSVSTLSSRKGIFVAVAYQHRAKTINFGKIVIRRYDKLSRTFQLFQTLKIKLPTKILFSELPSEEIVLYISTQTPSETFIAYLYEGVTGFARKIQTSAIPQAIDIKDLTLKNQHFVFVKHPNDSNVIQSVFKGIKFKD